MIGKQGYFKLILFSLLANGILLVNCNPIVCISDLGCVQGTYMPGYQNEMFAAFMGIPFAQPPVGELRFMAPKPYKPWHSLIDATKPKPDCLQKNDLLPLRPINGKEDCLYLNVYRPLKFLNNTSPAPVMVYIHGGGFFSGSANPRIHGPEYFMDTKEVIFVSVAYRLGPFGFLSTGDAIMSGNFGLKDQNLALEWIKRNIAAFGGNPKSVTIFGQSAGAVSVHMHMFSEASKGLFHKAISLSGVANAPFATPLSDPLSQTREIARICGFRKTEEMNSSQLVVALRSVDALKLVKSGDGLKYWDVDSLTNFSPVIEPISNPDAFLTEDPAEQIRSGNYTRNLVPWVTGIVPNEGAIRAIAIIENATLRSDFNTKFNYLIEKYLKLPNFSGLKPRNKIYEIIDVYLNGKHELSNATTQGFLDMVTDRAFRHPLYENVIKHVHENSKKQQSQLFLYKFNYIGPFSYSQIFTGNNSNPFNYGVIHCDDLIYLFRSPEFLPDFEKNSTEAAVIKEFVGRFVEFAKNDDNSAKPPFEACTADISTADNQLCRFTEISNHGDYYKVETNNNFNITRMRFWDRILQP